jgi:hypothetical protein
MNEHLFSPNPFAMRFHIIEDQHMEDRQEDWSGVRSPSRAKRRLKRGFPQRIRVFFTPKPDAYVINGDTYVMHPVTAARFREQLRSIPIAHSSSVTPL